MPAKLLTRQLGNNGPQVTALGFGAMGISSILYGDVAPDKERLGLLDEVYNKGCLNWDTAEGYADSEELIGKWFAKRGKRNEVFLATKFGVRMGANGQREIRNDREYIRMAVDRSLKRLQTDYIDLWYCHRLDGTVPVETVVSTMAESVKAGKVKHLGLSECSASSLRRANKVHPIAAVQIEYSPFTMDIEDPAIGLLATCRELGVAVIAYSPLGRGMLTGQYRSPNDFHENDGRRNLPRFSDENFAKNLQLVDKLKAIAEQKGCTTGQLTLAWLMRQGGDIIPIPGTKRVEYLRENLGSLDVELTDEEDGNIRMAVEAAETSGERYPPNMMRFNFADTPPLE